MIKKKPSIMGVITDYITAIPTHLSLQSVLIILLIALSTFLILSNQRSRIPGPFTIPIFGSVFVLPGFLSRKARHTVRVDLAKKYGKIHAVYLGNVPFVFLNEVGG